MPYSAFGVDHGYEEVSKAMEVHIGGKPAMDVVRGALRPVKAAFQHGVSGAATPAPLAVHAKGAEPAFKAGNALNRAGTFAMKNKKAIGIGAGVGAVGGATAIGAKKRYS